MLTDAAIARLARHASAAVEGSGSGHTEYVHADSRRRYVVGGVVPARIFPIGTARPVIREAVRRMVRDAAAASLAFDTVGYWEDNGSVYVDLGDTWHAASSALGVARDRRELAIFDRLTGECIPVPPAFGALAH
ncbi:hypothetical protein SEA_HORTUS1_6 [Microbacterium phage Hortus1]|nr:hypothetical protein SEA_HORTUS1_117 [Microbacterium phage Hortus1]AWY05094.1 hypothetical protein SEA_HORTUS1_6 [Microbacterium phage Hortus1]AWY05580.1 hypothetical protein SEA_OLINDD_117 [Microbacterium phage OlinDD]AWY05687.1 hypothetical protein SEA_OLINDD_6 [Microbacterium phage OlinDD]